MQFNSIEPIDKALSGATTPGQRGPGSDSNEGVLRIPQTFSNTGTSPSDSVISTTLVGGGLTPLQSVYSTAPADRAMFIRGSLISLIKGRQVNKSRPDQVTASLLRIFYYLKCLHRFPCISCLFRYGLIRSQNYSSGFSFFALLSGLQKWLTVLFDIFYFQYYKFVCFPWLDSMNNCIFFFKFVAGNNNLGKMLNEKSSFLSQEWIQKQFVKLNNFYCRWKIIIKILYRNRLI